MHSIKLYYKQTEGATAHVRGAIDFYSSPPLKFLRSHFNPCYLQRTLNLNLTIKELNKS